MEADSVFCSVFSNASKSSKQDLFQGTYSVWKWLYKHGILCLFSRGLDKYEKKRKGKSYNLSGKNDHIKNNDLF